MIEDLLDGVDFKKRGSLDDISGEIENLILLACQVNDLPKLFSFSPEGLVLCSNFAEKLPAILQKPATPLVILGLSDLVVPANISHRLHSPETLKQNWQLRIYKPFSLLQIVCKLCNYIVCCEQTA